jgi:hypothetical protein
MDRLMMGRANRELNLFHCQIVDFHCVIILVILLNDGIPLGSIVVG